MDYQKKIYRGYEIVVDILTPQNFEYTIYCDHKYVDWNCDFTTPQEAFEAAKKFIETLTPTLKFI